MASESCQDILDFLLYEGDDPILSHEFSPFLKQDELDIFQDLQSMLQQQQPSPDNQCMTSDNELWKSFLNVDDGVCTSKTRTVSVPGSEDSFSEQSSPQSHSDGSSSPAQYANSEHSESSLETVAQQNNASVLNFIHDYSSLSKVASNDEGMDVGADVIVVTSESPDIWTVQTSAVENITQVVDEGQGTSDDDAMDDICSITYHQGIQGPQILKLTAEERRLFRKEGLQIPTHLPLTKAEERELKRIRRKIRNKQSAQDSRKRKKEYVEGLENRVKLCSSQNIQLQKRIEVLEKQNTSLLNQLKRLQSLVSSTAAKPVQTSTCLMVLLLSFVLLLIPSWAPSAMNKSLSFSPGSKSSPIPGNSRTLLHKTEVGANEIVMENDNFSLAVEKKSEYLPDTDKMYIKEESMIQPQKDEIPFSSIFHSEDFMKTESPVISNFSDAPIPIQPVEEQVIVKWAHET